MTRWVFVFFTIIASSFVLLSLGCAQENSKGASEDEFQTMIKLAELGDPNDKYLLGVMYDSGTYVPEDDGAAVKWYLKAAEQGHVAAQGRLIVMMFGRVLFVHITELSHCGLIRP